MTVRIPPVHPGERSEVYTVDFRETAPALANSTMYPPGSNTSWYGGLAVAVPGELRGLEEAHRRWGSLPWKTLVQPSVELASGWRVDNELGKRITVGFRPKLPSQILINLIEQWYPDTMLYNPDWSAVFAPHGRLLREGELIHRTNYSRTLAAIASHGADAFYKARLMLRLLFHC